MYAHMNFDELEQCAMVLRHGQTNNMEIDWWASKCRSEHGLFIYLFV